MMSEEAEQEQDYEGVPWEEDLEDDTLAIVQQELENHYDLDFSELDFGKKGFTSEGLPFYTDLEVEFELRSNGRTEEVELYIERDDEMNTVEFWADSGETMQEFREHLDTHSKESKGRMLEPYKIKNLKDREILSLLGSLEDRYELEGPDRNPQKGETRSYPVRLKDLEEGEYLFDAGEEEEIRLEEDEREYSPENSFLPGEAEFQVRGEAPGEIEIDAILRIREQRAQRGLYKIEIDADFEDRHSQTALAYDVERVLNEN